MKEIMHFPTWVDLKGNDVVPETVHHILCHVNPETDRSWQVCVTLTLLLTLFSSPFWVVLSDLLLVLGYTFLSLNICLVFLGAENEYLRLLNTRNLRLCFIN